MVAGGGASVIYADTVGDLGYAHELGNYAEYSGAPSMAETCMAPADQHASQMTRGHCVHFSSGPVLATQL